MLLGLPQIRFSPETVLGPRCFRNIDSKQPTCAVHNVPLVQTTISIDQNAPHLGGVPCFICPVSNTVVEELEPPKLQSTEGMVRREVDSWLVRLGHTEPRRRADGILAQEAS
jgi:hypothetical protein